MTMTSGTVLGVSMSNHDRSACLLRDGRVVGAIAEERLDRRKRSEGFYRHAARGIVMPPMRAITRLLRDEGLALPDLDLVVCGRSVKEARASFVDHVPVDPARVVEPPMPAHHLAHGYSAYQTSPHDETAVLVIDEQGSWLGESFERCTWFTGSGGPLKVVRRFFGQRTDLSLGMFYNVFAALTGLSEASRPAAGKMMSLAGLGGHRDDWPTLLSLHAHGDVGCSLTALDEFLAAAGVPAQPGMRDLAVRELDELLVKYQPVGWRSDLAHDLACKAQEELETGILHTASALRQHVDTGVLAYAGGVALNCTVNARLREAGWEDVHIHPAATDDGAAVGLACYGWVEVLGNERRPCPAFEVQVGTRYDEATLGQALSTYSLSGHAREADVGAVAELVASGAVVCWFDGRSEWGPRALGARSIVADPGAPGIAQRLNATIKFREEFRPFGISVLADAAETILDRGQAPDDLDHYMLSVARPAHPGLTSVTHRDGTLRYQLVEQQRQPEWHALIAAVAERTGLPAVINTSFNTLGEPLVESPGDAVRQFLLSGSDALWLQGHLVVAAELPGQIRRAGRDLAWNRSGLHPLTAAAGLAESGYPMAAGEVLAEHGVDEDYVRRQGPGQTRLFHTLHMWQALAKGDTGVAVHHAIRVLESSMVPADALRAAAVLAKQDSETPEIVTGRLIGALCAGRDLLTIFRGLLAGGPAGNGTTPGVTS